MKERRLSLAKTARLAAPLAACLATLGLAAADAPRDAAPPAPAAQTPAHVASATADVPELLAPVELVDDEGKAETGFVDPFSRRRDTGAEGQGGTDEDGLLRTSMGEISSEFRILAISIPADTNAVKSALIQFYTSDEPILVHEGDLVRVDREGTRQGPGMARRVAAGRVRGRSAVARRSGARQSAIDEELEEQLRKFVFYVNVKHIEPTYIEVYHNKKRPDETIRLNW